MEILDYPNKSLFSPVPRTLYSLSIGCLGTAGLIWTFRDWSARKSNRSPIEDAGITSIYPKGLVGDYGHLEEAHTIDMLSISLRGLLECKAPLQTAILNNHAAIRILILRPNSLFVREREQQEGYELRKGQIAKECQATLDRTRELSRQIRSENARRIALGLAPSTGIIEVRTYDTMPYCSCVITDKLTRYTPYLIHERAGYTPAYEFSPSGDLAQAIRQHFNKLWERAHVEFYDNFIVDRPDQIQRGGQQSS